MPIFGDFFSPHFLFPYGEAPLEKHRELSICAALPKSMLLGPRHSFFLCKDVDCP